MKIRQVNSVVCTLIMFLACRVARSGQSSGSFTHVTAQIVPGANSDIYVSALTAGPDGAVWFLAGSQIGRITAAGDLTQFSELGCCSMTVGADAALWFPAYESSGFYYIGRMSTAGEYKAYPIPTNGAGIWGIAAGSDGALWFTEVLAGKIGRMSTAGVVTAEYSLPDTSSYPYSITAGPDGALWFTENKANKIGRITTDGSLTEYPVPTRDSSPQGIASGPDGAVWFAEDFTGKIGRISTLGAMTEYQVPGHQGLPQSIAALPDGTLWFTTVDARPAYSGKRIGRITTSGVITAYPIHLPSSYPTAVAVGPDRAVWFTQQGSASQSYIAHAPACGIGLSSSRANGLVTANFMLGIDRPATWTVQAGNKTRRRRIGAVTPPRAFSMTFEIPGQRKVRVESKLLNASGKVLCSEWTMASIP